MNQGAFFSLILASQSPRRKQLLEGVGFSFRTVSPTGDEAFPERDQAVPVAKANAVQKAKSVFHSIDVGQDEIVLGSDTLVVLNGHAIGKPVDQEDAKKTLRLLAGKTHTVVTGVALLSKRWGEKSATAESRVTFRPISEAEIEAYTLLKEPYDKAGSYAVQGASALFIDKIEGSFSNVMGLPLELLLKMLAELTQKSVFDLFEKR